MVVGRAVGTRIFPVLQPAKIRMVETARVVASLVMWCVKKSQTLPPVMTLPQLRRVSIALYLAITVGVHRMQRSL